jgi:DNA-binding transcriptional regulator YiaG
MNPENAPATAPATVVGSSYGTATDETDEVLRQLDEKFAARIKACRESERLSEEDFAIRINVRE